MAWETRGNRQYYYRKRRVGSRVVSEYVGCGELAVLIARLDMMERDKQDEERYRSLEEQTQLMAQEKEVAGLEQTINTLVQGILMIEGYHTHKGEWRRKRDKEPGK